MKISYLIQGIVAICIALLPQACTDEKFYDMGGWGAQKVTFTATNLDLDSTYRVESTISDYYYSLDRYDKIFPIRVYYSYDGNTESYATDVHTDRESVIWSGGYNNIRITFTPSASEEKEAYFTMPDGSTFTATADRPTFIWTPDSSLRGGYYNIEDTYIEARSAYKINNTEYLNEGRIFVYLDGDLRYNRIENRWYSSQWLYR